MTATPPDFYRLEMHEKERSAILQLLLPGSVVVGMLWYLLADTDQWGARIYLFNLVLISFPFVSWALVARHRTLGYGLILAGDLALGILCMAWVSPSVGLCLLAGLSALASLLLSARGGLLTAVGTSAFAIAAHWVLPISGGAQAAALLLIWLTQGCLWAARRGATDAVEWAEQSYRTTRTLLDEARDQRYQLKETQDALLQANAELRRMSDHLAAMREAADQARHAKEQFVANVSHELRTPLNMILGFSEMVVGMPQAYGQVPPALLVDLRVIQRNSQHLSELIDDVLDLSQIEAGRWALTKERVGYADLVASAVQSVRPLFTSKNLYLTLEAEEVPDILCDRTRIREVLLNLLSNAGRFTEQGGVRVSVRRDGEHLVTAVSDTGPGIAPEDQRRLFQPFEQLDRTLNRKKGGSGLGLSISRAFVELHGGRMWLESALGMGTTVFFRLPIRPAEALRSGPSRWFNPYVPYEVREHPTAAPSHTLRPRYVVLGSRDPIQRLLRRYMEEVEIVVASSLPEALERLAETPSQALLVNTGSVSESLADIEAVSPLPFGAPAILCSIPGARHAGESQGAVDYLVKPVTPDALLGALARLNLSRRTVLIVDDEPEALRLYQRMLMSSEEPYRVLRASDGQQALSIAHRDPPDAILLDLVMPTMDGFRFLQTKHEDPTLRDTPVIIVSARDPSGQPIVSNSLSLISGEGLSVAQVLAGVQALSAIAAPARHSSVPAP